MSYRVQSPDTSYEIEQVQVALFRRRGEAGRGRFDALSNSDYPLAFLPKCVKAQPRLSAGTTALPTLPPPGKN